MSKVIGSPEWFHEEAQKADKIDFGHTIESLRMDFLRRYAPEKLAAMSGSELLEEVFGDGDSMLNGLMFSDDYRQFGAPGSYKYLWIVYREAGVTWKYKEGSRAEVVSRAIAEERAEQIRNGLLECVDIIGKSKLDSVSEYELVEEQMAKVFFYKYSWVLKYFQMVFPYYFPGMYADTTLERALYILGLPDHGKSKRFINAGEISLFIRRCNINNIVFNKIYSGKWGWDTPEERCESADKNSLNRMKIPSDIDMSLYRLSSYDELGDRNSYSEESDTRNDSDKIHAVVQGTEVLHTCKCALCGLTNEKLLSCFNIKPFEKCDNKEKNDNNNKIILCPNHSKLFVEGWISFDDTGKIIISDRIWIGCI